MKAAALLLVCLAAPLSAQPVVIYQPATPSTVVSPLTNPTAASSQSLLNQINATNTQRRFEHQVLTTNAAVRAATINAARPER